VGAGSLRPSPRPIKSFHFLRFPSNCSLTLCVCVSVWHSLYSSAGQQQTVFARCKLNSLNSALVSWAAATGGVAFWVAKQQTWCTQCLTLRSCSAQLMICGRLATMRMWSCPLSCRTTLQRAFFLKDMASLVAFAWLRWDLVRPTCTDCINTTSHQSVLVAYNFGLATSCNPDFDAIVHFNSSNILSVCDSFVVV